MADKEQHARVRNEVEALHAAIDRWVRGDVPQDTAWFRAQFADRLAPDFVNIQPAGKILTRADLIGDIEGMYGANRSFHIEIRDVRLVAAFGEPAALVASYIEDQTGARNSVARNSRISTVTMRLDSEPALWLHLQETAILNS